MGILDFFKRKRVDNKSQQGREQEKIYPEMNLDYSYPNGDNIMANVKFMDVEDYVLPNGKSSHLQKISIMYTNSKTNGFESKSYYIDPVVMQDANGNYVYDSASYFESLNKTRPDLVNSFFEKGGITNLPSDYIGHLSGDDNVGYSRSFNQQNGFYADYINEYQRKLKEQEQSRAQRFAAETSRLVNEPHEIHYKTSHAEELTPEMYKEMFGDR